MVPILSTHLLKSANAKSKKTGTPRWSQRAYENGMGRLLNHPWIALLAVLPLLLIGWIAFGHVKSGFMPSMDEGSFILDYNAPPGTSLNETDRELGQVEAILSANPAVDTYSRRTGLQLGGGITEANQGDFFVRLKPFPRPPIDQVMTEVRQKIEHTIPALRIETSQLMEDLIGDLTGVPQPIDIKLFAPDEKTLLEVAPKVADAIRKINGVVAVKDGVVPAGDALEIRVNRVQAALEGVSPESITQFLDNHLSGTVTTRIQQGPELIGVRIWIPHDMRSSQRDLKNLTFVAPDGHRFPIESVATLNTISGQPQIDREDLKRMTAVTARIAGRDLGSTMADVKQILDRPGLLPKGMTYQLGGTYQQQRQSFRGLLMVMIAALLLVFLLLLFLYESFLVALAMMLIIFQAIAAVFIGLWVTGTELDIMSIMGMTMIVGIVTEVSIFYFSEYQDLRGEPENNHRGPRDLLVASGVRRARAISMTTIAAILALITLALGIGQGSALLQPLAIAIISGLVAQLVLVLVILPALLTLFRAAR